MPKMAAANLSHRRAQSHGKPVVAKRSSENVLPNLQPGQHPPLHRSNRSAHEFGHPYKSRKFNASTGQLNLSAQRSLDSLPLFAHGATTVPSTPYPSLTISEPPESTYIKSENNSPALMPATTMKGPNPFPDLNTSLMHSALSPHNPQRYSMNDFSNFNWPGFSSNDLSDQYSAASARSDQGSYDWSSVAGDSPYCYNTISDQPNQRSSVVSLEQPGLSHSPSVSTSDVGDLLPETNYPSSPMPSSTIDPSWMSKSADELPETGFEVPSYPGMTHDLVFRPSQQPAVTYGDYFTAAISDTAPLQTQADPYDESQFLTPTHEHGRYAQPMAPVIKFDDHEAWSMHLAPPDINFQLQNQDQEQHQQYNTHFAHPGTGHTEQW